jgi:hypothetical protein
MVDQHDAADIHLLVVLDQLPLLLERARPALYHVEGRPVRHPVDRQVREHARHVRPVRLGRLTRQPGAAEQPAGTGPLVVPVAAATIRPQVPAGREGWSVVVFE